MDKKQIHILTGFFGIIVFVLTLIEFPFYMAGGEAPPFQDVSQFTSFVAGSSHFFLIRIFLDILLCCSYLVFIAGFKQMILDHDRKYEFIANIWSSSGIALTTITLVADSIQAGVALDTIGYIPDPSVLRGLTESYLLLYGTAGCSLIALNSFAGAVSIIKTGILPRWCGIVAFIVGILNVIMLPSMFGGSDPRKFYSASGWGVAVTATFPWVILIFIIGFNSLRKGFRMSKTV